LRQGSNVDDSDAALLNRAIRGDHAALTELLEREGLAVHSYIAARIPAAHRAQFDADDVMQITCLEAFMNIAAFEPAGARSFAAWLRRLAENNLRDALRELERDKRPPPSKRVGAALSHDSYVALVERISATTTTASRLLGRDEPRQAGHAALAQLPADYAEAVRLYDLEELTGAEVANRMGRSHGAVRMLLARAHERLADVLGRESRFSARP
jgi:RNA polymerase sigma-70 factor (ECF subfamily)